MRWKEVEETLENCGNYVGERLRLVPTQLHINIQQYLGKLLYSLYNSSHKPVISYPKVKTKTPQQMADEEARKKAAQKGCPQRAYVDVPSVKKENKRKFHMIDCVPKRKTETDIKQEIKEHYQHKLVPPQKGKNREEMKCIYIFTIYILYSYTSREISVWESRRSKETN